MSRHIDAEPIIKFFDDNKSNYGAISFDGVIKILNDTPTADVVETPVRCRECKKKEKDMLDSDRIYCAHFLHYVKPDDFCSYGERKDDES